MIIAITGYKRSGKTTVANYIVKNYGFYKYSFASPIKEAVKVIFGWTEEYVNGKYKEVIDKRWGISPRQAMQYLGTEYAQYNLPDMFPEFKKITGKKLWAKRFAIWFKENNIKNAVIDDLRFLHELEVLKDLQTQVFVIKIKRKLFNTDNHESEQQIDKLPVDFNLININISLSELYKKVDKLLLKDLKLIK